MKNWHWYASLILTILVGANASCAWMDDAAVRTLLAWLSSVGIVLLHGVKSQGSPAEAPKEPAKV